MATLYAKMGSTGPWYETVIKVHGVLGARAVAAGLCRWEFVNQEIESRLIDALPKPHGAAPTRRTMITWANQEPDLPERSLEDGFVDRSEILGWAATQLRGQPTAHMGLQIHKPKTKIGPLLIGAGILWLLSSAARKGGNGPNSGKLYGRSRRSKVIVNQPDRDNPASS